ncbi:MAG: CDC27 family protein [Candidatus Wallbacteria bacterium]|nr:CDC27 family protein [Candidatus Wallbacteria bacterium]
MRFFVLWLVLFIPRTGQTFEKHLFDSDSPFLNQKDNFAAVHFDFLGVTTIETADRVSLFVDIFASAGEHLILDQYSRRIHVLSSSGPAYSIPISAPGTLRSLFQDAHRNIFVISGDSIIQIDRFGNLHSMIGKGRGRDPEFFFEPSFLFIDSDGYIYVSDTGNERVQIFNPKRELVYILDKGAAGFTSPAGIGVTGAGEILVSDIFEDRVLLFDENARFKRNFGTSGTAPGYFHYPEKILMDPLGQIYVLDRFNNRVQKFDRSGRLITVIIPGPGTMKSLRSFAVDSAGEIWFIDGRTPWIRRFGTDYFRRGRACFAAGDLNPAARLFDLALELKPENQYAAYYLAYCHFADKDYSGAYRMLKRSRDINPGTTCGMFAAQQMMELEKWYRVKALD